MDMADELSGYMYHKNNDELICPGCFLYHSGECFKTNPVADDNCLKRMINHFHRKWVVHGGKDD